MGEVHNDPDVLFVSLHQEQSFPPNRGFVHQSGEGDGKGYNINIPLPAGTGNAGYLYALEKLIVPVANQFQPELILVSAGQDPSVFDPLAQMMVTADGLHKIATVVKQIAEQHCHGRMVVCHEGGYSSAYVPFCTLRVIEAISGLQSVVVEDPFQLGVESLPSNILADSSKRCRIRSSQNAVRFLGINIIKYKTNKKTHPIK